jgi:hypothetical protein
MGVVVEQRHDARRRAVRHRLSCPRDEFAGSEQHEARSEGGNCVSGASSITYGLDGPDSLSLRLPTAPSHDPLGAVQDFVRHEVASHGDGDLERVASA